jgi:hypothetical protein
MNHLNLRNYLFQRNFKHYFFKYCFLFNWDLLASYRNWYSMSLKFKFLNFFVFLIVLNIWAEILKVISLLMSVLLSDLVIYFKWYGLFSCLISSSGPLFSLNYFFCCVSNIILFLLKNIHYAPFWGAFWNKVLLCSPVFQALKLWSSSIHLLSTRTVHVGHMPASHSAPYEYIVLFGLLSLLLLT